LVSEALEQIAAIALKEHFIAGYPSNKNTLHEALGCSIASYTDWDGKEICDIFLAALEDANAHTLANEIEGLMKKRGWIK